MLKNIQNARVLQHATLLHARIILFKVIYMLTTLLNNSCLLFLFLVKLIGGEFFSLNFGLDYLKLLMVLLKSV